MADDETKGEERATKMRNEERAVARQRLDKEQRLYRAAGKRQPVYPKWLREVRRALGASSVAMAKELGVQRSTIFRMEESEARQTKGPPRRTIACRAALMTPHLLKLHQMNRYPLMTNKGKPFFRMKSRRG